MRLSNATLWTICIVVAAVACGGDDFTPCQGAACGEGGGRAVGGASSTGQSAGGEGGGTSATAGIGGSVPGCDGVCVPKPGSGFGDSFMSLYIGSSSPSCGSAAELLHAHNGELTAETACSACTCGAASGGSCALPNVTFYSASNCTGTPQTLSILGNQACKNIVLSFQPYGSLKILPPAVTHGSCSASGGELVAGPATASEQALGCALDSAPSDACGAGSACVSVPPDPFPLRVCVQGGPDADCPEGLPAKYVLYTEVEDTRSCTACQCGTASTTCRGTLSGYNSSNCATFDDTLNVQDGCTNNQVWGSMKWNSGLSQGTCPPSGGEVEGEVAPAGPITVCCIE